MDLEGAASTDEDVDFLLNSSLFPIVDFAGGADAIPCGLTLTPLAPLSENLVLHREPLRCENCGGYIGPHCDVFVGSWRCGLCGTENRSLTLSTPSPEAVQPELSSSCVEYVLRPPPRVKTAATKMPPPSVVLFLVDDTAGAAALSDALAGVRASLPLLPPDALIGLLTFGRAIGVYLLGEQEDGGNADLVEALMLPAADAPVQWELDALKQRINTILAPRQKCETRLVKALEALQPAESKAASSSSSGSRGLLAAIDLSLDILALTAGGKKERPPCCGQLVVLPLTGPPNHGRGALPRVTARAKDDADDDERQPNTPPPRTPGRDAALSAFKDTGKSLGRAGLSLFIACIGPIGSFFDVEALRSLVLPCGGSVSVLRSAVAATALSAQLSELLGSLPRRGSCGALSVRCSDGMSVSEVIGGAAPFEREDESIAGEAASGDGVCFLGAIHPTTTLSLMLDVSEVSGDWKRRPSAYVQAALRYIRPDGEQRLRTYLVRAPFAKSLDEWLRSLDADATSLLASRLIALRACATEKDARDGGNALAAHVDDFGAGWARRYGAPRTVLERGWLRNYERTIGYDASATIHLPYLLEGLHKLRSSQAAVHAGVADPDAAHAARVMLLTARAEVAKAVAGGANKAKEEEETGAAGRFKSLSLADEEPDMSRWASESLGGVVLG